MHTKSSNLNVRQQWQKIDIMYRSNIKHQIYEFSCQTMQTTVPLVQLEALTASCDGQCRTF